MHSRFPTKISKLITDRLVGYLSRPIRRYRRLGTASPPDYADWLLPGDLILVEGNNRFSEIVKYITRSTWTHVAMYVGNIFDYPPRSLDAPVLIEADIHGGVIASPLQTYSGYNTRICRPVGLQTTDQEQLVDYMMGRLGHQYDLRNIVDLMRFLLPVPVVFSRHKRRYSAMGRGDPFEVICSSIIAQAFQSIRYPILPRRGQECTNDPADTHNLDLICVRHHTHITPRDFDLSPYFSVIKPTLKRGFQYRSLQWGKGTLSPAKT